MQCPWKIRDERMGDGWEFIQSETGTPISMPLSYIPHIWHFSPHFQFWAKFFVTKNIVNWNKTDFATNQHTLCDKTPQMGHIIYLVMVKERTDVRYATNMRNMNARMICELLVARRYASCHVLDWMNLANWGN